MRIEPYSRDIRKCDTVKRYHEIIIKMWEDYATHEEIAEALVKYGCKKVDRKTILAYIHRCFEEEGLPHDYSLPQPETLQTNICRKHHERIAYLRNYLGYSQKEIADDIGVSLRTTQDYIGACVRRMRNDKN